MSEIKRENALYKGSYITLYTDHEGHFAVYYGNCHTPESSPIHSCCVAWIKKDAAFAGLTFQEWVDRVLA